MKAEVDHVYNNFRYKILNFNEEYYILDMDRSLWFVLFPFVFWFIPHKAYKIDKETYKLIQMPESKKMSVGSMALLGGGISILFVNLLKPVLYALNIPVALGTKFFLFIMIIIVSILLRLYIHRRFFENLNKKINIKSLYTIKLKVNPEKPKYYLLYPLAYLLVWGLVLLPTTIFFEEGNVIAFIGVLCFTFLVLIWNIKVIPVGVAEVTLIDE